MTRVPKHLTLIRPCNRYKCPNWDSNSNGGFCMSPTSSCITKPKKKKKK